MTLELFPSRMMLFLIVFMSCSIQSCTIQKSQLVPDLFVAEKQVSVYRLTESSSKNYDKEPVYLIISYQTAELTTGNCSCFYALEFQNDTINLRERCSIIDGKITVPDENVASTLCLLFLDNGRILKGLDNSDSSELSCSEVVDSMEDLMTGSSFTIVPYVLPSKKAMSKCLTNSLVQRNILAPKVIKPCFHSSHSHDSVADNDINIYIELRGKYECRPHIYGYFEPLYLIIRNNTAEIASRYFNFLFDTSYNKDTLTIKHPYDVYRGSYDDCEYTFIKNDLESTLTNVTDYPDSLQMKINDNEYIIYENPEKADKYVSYIKLIPSNRKRDLSRKLTFNIHPFIPFY